MRKLLMASVATLGTLLATGAAHAQPVKPVAPGTIVVHLNGRFQFEMANVGSSVNTVMSSQTGSSGAYKLNPVTADGEFRLYPGFDAKTLTGIDYGAQAEIRTAFSNAGVGQNGGKATVTGTTSSQDSLYVRRAYGYIGTENYGYVRFGQTDPATSLLQVGVIDKFGDGNGWKNDGGVATTLPTAAAPGGTIVWGDASKLYGANKVVYISPKLYGFNMAASYEPNSNGLNEGYYSNTSAGSTSASLASSPTAADIGTRRRNTVDVGVAYGIKQWGAAFKTSATYLHSSPLNYTGSTPLWSGYPGRSYSNMDVYQFGAQVTYAGLTLGGNIKGGSVEDDYAFRPQGARNAFAWTAGTTYTVGPYVVGVNYFQSQTAGGWTPGSKMGRTLNENGLIVAGNYIVGKDMDIFLEYMYAQRHQAGNTKIGSGYINSSGTYVGSGHGQVQAIALGATLKW